MTHDLDMPAGLTARGKKAYQIIRDFLHNFGVNPDDPDTRESVLEYTGGCRAFYSPQEWRERGEYGGERAVLIVVYDGGDVGYAFEYDFEQYSIVDRMMEALSRAGFIAEPINGWSTAIYDDRASTMAKRARQLRR
jgi:hypothetical protein